MKHAIYTYLFYADHVRDGVGVALSFQWFGFNDTLPAYIWGQHESLNIISALNKFICMFTDN